MSHSRSIFDHITVSDSVPDEYLCNVCKNPILDAELATPCGHSFYGFCVSIFKTNQGQSGTCQMCRQPVTAFCSNRLANVVLGMVYGECKCCGEKIALNLTKDHIERCKEFEITCQECQESMKRKQIEAHKATCSMVDVLCKCGISFKRKYQKNHEDVTCSVMEVPCPLKCGKNVTRCLIPSHSIDCGERVLICPVRGCEKAIRKKNKEEHMEGNQQRHLSLLTKERQKLLWDVLANVPQNVKPTPNGLFSIFTWKLPAAKPNAVMRSPIFEKWERQWCILVDTNDCTYLQYSQGVDQACLCVSCSLRIAGKKPTVYIVPVVTLQEGKMVRLADKMPPDTRCVTMKLEMLVPEIVED